MSASSTPPASDKQSGKGAAWGIGVGILFALLAVVLLPTTVVIAVGLVPAAVAFFVDSSRERLLGSTVLCMNAAGVLPAVLRLWKQGHNMDTAIQIITQPIILTVILVSSGVGWLLYIYTPQFVGKLVRKRAEMRIRALEKYQKELVDHWSPAVAAGILVDETNDKSDKARDKESLSAGSLTA